MDLVRSGPTLFGFKLAGTMTHMFERSASSSSRSLVSRWFRALWNCPTRLRALLISLCMEECCGTQAVSAWRTFVVKAEGGHFGVSLDGRRVLDYIDPRPLGRGYIGLQFNQGNVEFRNIKLKPLGLVSIFNGRDLTGWKVFPGKKSKFTVTPEGALNVKNGNGQLDQCESPCTDNGSCDDSELFGASTTCASTTLMPNTATS